MFYLTGASVLLSERQYVLSDRDLCVVELETVCFI